VDRVYIVIKISLYGWCGTARGEASCQPGQVIVSTSPTVDYLPTFCDR